MTQNPDFLTGVGEDVAATIDNQARRAALFQIAVDDLLFLAHHGDVELLRAVRDLNIHPGSPDSYRHAYEVQMIRGTLRHLLTSLELEDTIVSEPIGEIAAPSRNVRPPIIDVELP